MAFVVDASVAAGWLLPDEKTEIADALAFRMQAEDAIAPDLFWHEARSLLVTALRRGRITEAAVYISLDRLATIPLRNAGASDAVTVTRLAIRHGLSAYDAAYLDLALREHLPLATLDKKLAAAARAEKVAVLGPLGASWSTLVVGRPVEALRAWLEFSKIDSGPVFRGIDKWGTIGAGALDPQSVNAIIKSRCARAELDPAQYSAHGLRSGYLTQAAREGVPLQEAMQQSQHRSVQQAARYYNERQIARGRAARLA